MTAFVLFAGAGQAMATFAVGDRVWNDVNNNGLFDANEVGIAGVVVGLHADTNNTCVSDSGVALRTTTTNASGSYLFTGVGSSQYVVQLESSNFTGTGALVGYTSSTGTAGSTTGPYEPGLRESNNAADNNKDHGTMFGAGTASAQIRACGVIIVGGTEPIGEGNQPPGIVNPDTDANTNATIDFGVYKPTLLGSVGDRVWEDLNHNGLQDAGEPGVPGVTVKLLDATGVTLLATTTTNATGNYLFSNRAPGAYTIDFVKPAGAEFTIEDIGLDQALDSDPPAATGRTTEPVIVGGRTNTDIDAGIWYPMTLGNLVFRDANNNGLFDAATESGIGGVTVELLNAAGTTVLATTTTATVGAVGTYQFTNLLAGDYRVRVSGTPLAGLNSSTGGATEPGPDPDNNIDNDDNGTGTAGTAISLPVTLSSNTEPTTDGDGANGNLTVDFGFTPPQPGALGDRVWLDQNRNGAQDAGEPGVAGVTVNLLNATATAQLATTTTDASGNYLFSNLAAGSYVIDFIKPAGSEFTLEDAVVDQNLDSDPAVATGRTSEGVVTAGQTNTQIDAGIYFPLTLGNLVWRDLNNNGLFDAATESGIGSVTVELLNAGGTVVGTTITSPAGIYTFTGLAPGDYSVRVSGAALTGLQSSTGNDPAPDPDNNVDNDDNGPTVAGGPYTSAPVTLASGTEPINDGDGNNGNLTVDFGFFAPATVGDFVWLDKNGNGIQDPGEPGVGGVTVSLCTSPAPPAAPVVIATTTTAADGGYTFTNVAPGNVRVGFTGLPAGAVLTPANQGADDAKDSDASAVGTCTIPVTLTSGQTDNSVDAGLYFPLTLGNFVWNDADNDGVFDVGVELPIANVVVQLLNAAGTQIAQTSTNAAGNYTFSGLAPGIYSVRIPASNFATTPVAGPLAGLVSSVGGPDPDNDVDNDDNGVVSGADVVSLQVTLSSGDEPTTDGDGSSGNLTVDFGFAPPANAVIGDFVWVDQNGNGVQDPGEPGVGGATVTLCNSAGVVVATTQSAPDGSYQFANLAAGSYRVGFSVLPAGTVLTSANQGANDAVDSDAPVVGVCSDPVAGIPVTLVAGQVNRTVDAGVYFPLTLGNLVWLDSNNNGLVDGEPGISGVTVDLLNAAGATIGTTTTNGLGVYSFSGLAPGDYRVRVSGAPLAGRVSSTGGGSEPAPDPDVDADDNDDNGTLRADGSVTSELITLASGTEPTTDGDGNNGNQTLDFGFTPTPASIGDFVWLDLNGNGIQDPGEPGVAGVTVSLCTAPTPPAAPTVIATTATDATGKYLFQNVVPGSYNVGFTNIPTGSQLTAANQGANDAVDSDATTVGPCTIPVTVTPGQSNTSVDAGVYFPVSLGNLVWRDLNNDGITQAGEPGISGVTVELLNAQGSPVGTALTSGTGAYLFTGLAPGEYSVRIPGVGSGPLAGVTSSTGNGAAPDPDNNVDNDDNGPTEVAGVVTSLPITLTSNGEPTADGFGNNVNNTLDFGFTPLAAIGDRVWEDTNHNGIQDPGEPGLPGVTVNLCSPGPPPAVIKTTTTDINGNYAFTGLVPGSYQIGLPALPAGGQLTLANQPNEVADSDVTAVAPCNVPVTVAPGQINTDIDAGVWFPLTLGNKVWSDTNNNGLVDAGENGIAGVTVELLDAAGAVVGAPATTDANGLYTFTNVVAGDYSVRVAAANFAGAGPLVNFTNSTGNDPVPDPDTNVDNDDNGVTPAVAGGAVVSQPVTLLRGTEPDTAVDGDNTNGNLTVDFGFVPPAGLGDRVWDDTNHNGIQDAGELGLGGVTVTLCNSQGTLITTTLSNASGAYQFSNLAPGSYSVGFAGLPTGGQLTLANAGGDAVDSDAITLATPTTCNIPVTLAPNETNATIDAGVWFPLTLGNKVWSDTNNNGLVDAGENGIAGVTVELLDAAGAVVGAPATTDANGLYTFTNVVAGDYSVRVAAANFAGAGPLVNFTNSTGNNPVPDPDTNVDNDDNGVTPAVAGGAVVSQPVTLLRGTEPDTAVDGDNTNGNLTVDFGFVPLGSIGDFVWEDLDHDGIQDPNEPGLAGVEVTLCTAAGNRTVTTDANGRYVFTGLLPGTYQIGVATLPAGSQLTLANQGANDAVDSDVTSLGPCTVPVTLAGGQNNTSVDVGLWFPLTLGDLVWRDDNNSGTKDPTEPGIGGVTVDLLTATGTLVTSTTTAPDGTYSFTGLTPGDYVIRIPVTGVIANFTNSTGNGPAPDPDDDVNNDDNGTGTTVVTTAPITLQRGTEPPAAVDGDGVNANETLDVGFVPPASIGDRVWEDVNHNGIQDPGEPGLGGVTVTICNSQGALVTTTQSNASGAYVFSNLAPGSYSIGFSGVPAGGQLTLANAGGDAVDSDAVTPATDTTCNIPVTLSPGEPNTSVDAGVWFPLTLGDLIFRDVNNNGLADPGEPGIPNVTVQLLDQAGNVVATTTSDPSGAYTFTNLSTGDYSVRIPATQFASGAPLAGLASSTGGGVEPVIDPDNNVNNDDNGSAGPGGTVVTLPITLSRGDEPTTDGDGANGNLTVDLGFYLPDGAAASIGDFVWVDQNANGIQDPGEPGQPGVTVTLCQGGQVVGTRVTGPNGQYQFGNLTPGDYQIGFSSLPAGAQVSPANAGTNDAVDSDLVTPATATTCNIPVTVVAGEINTSVDAGFYELVRLGNLVWIDANNNGVVDGGEPGVPGVTMELLDASDAVIATTTTDQAGHYLFDNLQPGTYQVQVPAASFGAGAPLAGFVSSTGANASPVGSTEPGPGPDNDVDNDDNGTKVPDPATPPPTVPPAGDPGGGTGDGTGDDNSDNTDHGNNGIGLGVGGTTAAPKLAVAGRAAGAPGALISAPVTLTSRGEPDVAVDTDGRNGNLTVDFGVFNTGALIGDRVFNDQNQNGIQDPTDPGVGNVTVTLSQNGTPIAQAITPPNGIYVFVNVLPGTYTVTFSNLPPGTVFSPANEGANDALDSDADRTTGAVAVTVAAGDQNRTIDAGLILPSAIGDRVWSDTNANGIQDAGEPGVPGVTVTLFNASGGQVAHVTTDGNGAYLFPNLQAGNYTVGFTGLPAGTQLAPANQGGNDGVDSDADPSTGVTGVITLLAGQRNVTVDAGVVGATPQVVGQQNNGAPQPTTLSIRKRTNKTIVKVKSNVVFTITVRNTGTVAAQNVKVCDRIPAGVRFVSGKGSRLEGGRRCWTIASLAAGQSTTFRITLRPTKTGTKTNVATAVADNAPQVTGRASIRVLLTPGGIVIPPVTGFR